MSIRIDRCICYNRSFAELAQTARQTGVTTLAELQAQVAFGSKCGLCRPYVRRMLRTGETVFHTLITEADDN